MRAALWLLSLFALAVAGAWLAGHNNGTVAFFLSPYRVDVSLNLVLLVLGGVVLVVVLAQQALSALLSLPKQAQRWRVQQKERAAHAALLDAISHFMAGRFLRARKAAQTVLDKEALLSEAGMNLDHAVSLRTVAHIMVAESAHALQDKGLRQQHLDQALLQANQADAADRQTLTEGAQLRAARWLLDDRDAQASLAQLKALSPAVGRRMVAMRLQLKAARLAGQPAQALDTAALLAKHRAFTPEAADSLVRSLIMQWLTHVHDAEATQGVWNALSPAQRNMPDVVAEVVLRFMAQGGAASVARQWLLPLWPQLLALPVEWTADQRVRFVRALEVSLADAEAADARQWLARVETAQQAQPRDALLQYLSGMACLRHQLWGKSHNLLAQAVKGLQDAELRRRAWCALAELAEQRQDSVAATQAWKQAAQV
ncbi:heme biosynthesis HemY N-terminal domain-containing protein [Limnohabitans planktonicus]|uniref:Heme biosynthesis protein HemY n=1 Tax=Limnohabitans planktonicus II-D5 TaxID=1293045 RepID=A0A2T7UAF2_9BURK|nr:heme biosynthesis HemY N-terminal domain-containing protein [Limnohabitans planktonicus]PVE41648.1 heme biosynthesis protein HemY [Limnohabitans planktonicus II-D5]